MNPVARSSTAVNSIEALADVGPDGLAEILAQSTVPVLLRGLVADWSVVKQAQESNEQLDAYLRRFYSGATVGIFTGAPEIGGRFFYNDDLSGLNFEKSHARFDAMLDQLKLQRDNSASPSYYMGATTVDKCLPGFRAENDLDFGELDPLASIWIGNRSRIAAHYDLPDNLACVAAGHRRFTLFPPDQLANLYPGPIDFTPAGQQISLVDFHCPDLERFPGFTQALEHAQVVELGPGDALFIPSMWWHHVESLDSLNVLVNYWWRKSPAYMGPPVDVLYHALLSIRDLPAEQKQAWAGIFQHYIFNDEASLAHLPESRLGLLGTLDETMARKLRATLLNKLNR
jgi:hypothetical protein